MNQKMNDAVDRFLLEILPPIMVGVIQPDGKREDRDGNARKRAEAKRKMLRLLNTARAESIQLYMDTCEEQGVDPSWPTIHEFQQGQIEGLKHE